MTTRTKGRSCDGKKKYTRKQAAAEARKRRFGRYCSYKCKFCDHWHVGHTPPPRKKR